MGFEIRITSASPLEALSTLAAAANYCMFCPAVKDAANDMLSGEKSAATPGPRHDASGAVSAPASAPAPSQPVTPSAPPQNQPSVGVPVNPMAAVANGPSGYGYAYPAKAPGTAPVNPATPQNQPPVNPTTPGTGPAPTTMTQTSLFNGQSVQNPGPGAPTFTIAQLGKAGADLVTQNPAKRAELNMLLQQYGVPTISELKPEHLGYFAQALRGMGANI